MRIAHARNAVLEKKFYFRKNILPSRPRTPNHSAAGQVPSSASPREEEKQIPVEDEFTLLTIDEIVNGKHGSSKDDDEFVGLIPLIESYLNTVNVDVQTRCDLARYLELVSKRASGKLQTGASWIRNFVRSHAEYKGDSVVNDAINYDLLKAIERLGNADGNLQGLGKGLLE